MKTLTWQEVPQEICRLYKSAAGTYKLIQDIISDAPKVYSKIWYTPDRDEVTISYPSFVDNEKLAEVVNLLKTIPGISDRIVLGEWITPTDESAILVKQALENRAVFGPVASALHLKENPVNNLVGGPTPLISMLAGGALAGGLGYGAGYLADKLLPEKYFERGRLPKVLAALGGIAGAMPGLALGLDAHNRVPNAQGQPGLGWRGWITPHPLQQKISQYKEAGDYLLTFIPKEAQTINEQWIKYSEDGGGDYLPKIPVDQFNRTIWNDLRPYGGSTSPQLAAMTTGLTQAASLSSNTNLISPVDIARVGVGMGSGYLSGLVVGKTLGALAGLRPEAQESLQRVGIWAGLLSNIVPMVFR